ncbi:MAG: hypothetical protein NT062_14725 [Proteobacteria bacterium]|nr:hypothetical protein [Pseudomonadota bacterium]
MRATWILGATTALGFGLAAYLFVENRALRTTVADHAATPVASTASPRPDAWMDARPVAPVTPPTGSAATQARTEPKLPEPEQESRMERRARRTLEIAAFLGRHDGETEEQYRARMLPLLQAGLAIPREKALEMRKLAEEKAHVTPAQSAALDKAFDKVYGDVLDYTNKAIADGTLSPYERNVSGWLEFAGGMGGMLGEAQGQIGKILDPAQVRAMSDAGFEWGEYLGLSAPWERLQPPPPPR